MYRYNLCVCVCISKCHTFINRLMEHGNRSNRIISVIRMRTYLQMGVYLYSCVLYGTQWHIRIAWLPYKSQSGKEKWHLYTDNIQRYFLKSSESFNSLIPSYKIWHFLFPFGIQFDCLISCSQVTHKSLQYILIGYSLTIVNFIEFNHLNGIHTRVLWR